jgi:hypothetical protein
VRGAPGRQHIARAETWTYWLSQGAHSPRASLYPVMHRAIPVKCGFYSTMSHSDDPCRTHQEHQGAELTAQSFPAVTLPGAPCNLNPTHTPLACRAPSLNNHQAPVPGTSTTLGNPPVVPVVTPLPGMVATTSGPTFTTTGR